MMLSRSNITPDSLGASLRLSTSYAVLIGTGLLITLCGSANAATVHRSKPRHVQGLSFYAVPPRPPFHYDDTPTTTIRPSLAAARRYKNEATRSCSEFSSAFGGMADMADLLLARPGRECRPKQSRKVRFCRSARPSHLNPRYGAQASANKS
jgi:hypothetical protein